MTLLTVPQSRIDQSLDALLCFLLAAMPPGCIRTSGRRIKFWTDLKGRTPAIFVRHTADNDRWDGEQLAATEVEADVRIFTELGKNPDAVPDTAIDNITALVRSALAPDPVTSQYQTLPTPAWPNGICYYARVEGRSEFWPGDIDGMAEASISVRILLP